MPYNFTYPSISCIYIYLEILHVPLPTIFNFKMSSQQPIIIHDGGFSRELIKLNAPFKQPEWSALSLIESPDHVRQVHQAFANAGAQILTTNSYALVPFHIGSDRFWKDGRTLASLAGRLAREVADDFNARKGKKVLVAGSLPPIFGSYEPSKFDPETVQDYLSVLVSGMEPYVDFWLGETLSLIAEGEAVKEAVAPTEKPWSISFTLDDSKLDGERGEEPRLRGGESVTQAARWAKLAGVEALLFNCSSPEVMLPAIKTAAGVLSDRGPKIGVYANAFASVTREGSANESVSETRKDLTPELYLQFAREWVEAGASIVGGCCGVGCEHIDMLARELGKSEGGS